MRVPPPQLAPQQIVSFDPSSKVASPVIEVERVKADVSANKWMTGAKIALVAAASLTVLAASYYAWHYFGNATLPIPMSSSLSLGETVNEKPFSLDVCSLTSNLTDVFIEKVYPNLPVPFTSSIPFTPVEAPLAAFQNVTSPLLPLVQDVSPFQKPCELSVFDGVKFPSVANIRVPLVDKNISQIIPDVIESASSSIWSVFDVAPVLEPVVNVSTVPQNILDIVTEDLGLSVNVSEVLQPIANHKFCNLTAPLDSLSLLPTSKVLPSVELPSFVIQAGFDNSFTKGTSIAGPLVHSGGGKILEEKLKNVVKSTSDVALGTLESLWGTSKTLGAYTFLAAQWFAEAEGIRKALAVAVVVYARSQPTHSWINGGFAFPF